VVGTIFANEPYVYIKSRIGQMTEWADALQDFQQYWAVEEVGAYSVLSEAAIDFIKNGTMIIKNVWVHDIQPRLIYNERGKVERVEQTMYRGPKWFLCDLSDIRVPYEAKDLQTCQFLAHDVRLRWQEVLRRERVLGMYKSGFAEELKQHVTVPLQNDENEEAKKDLQGLRQVYPWLFETMKLTEMWMFYQVEAGKPEVPILVTIHEDSGKIARAIHHPLMSGQRPFSMARYMRRPNQFWGIGVAQSLKDLAEELSTIHNQTVDSGTIANVKCFKAKKNSGVTPNEKAYPGKIFFLDNMDDLEEFMLGEIKASSFKLSEEVMLWGEKRSGVSDYTLGRESGVMKSRATARGTLALISEGNRRFDLSLREFRGMYEELVKQNIELHQQYEPGGREWLRNMEVFSVAFPPTDIRHRLTFECSASSAAMNKQVEQETNIMLLDRAGAVYQMLMNYMQIATSPQAPPPMQKLAVQAAQSYHKLAQKVFKSLNVTDVETYLPKIEGALSEAIQFATAGAMAQPPGVGGVAGTPPPGTPGNGGGNGQAGPPMFNMGGNAGGQKQSGVAQ